MGVRFECPAGHKLHVKAHLSGQRAICPECGARFIVPSFSGGRVAEVPSSDSSSRMSSGSGFVTVDIESTASFNAGLDAATAGSGPGDPVSWYVRPPLGGQYGPVDTAEFRVWIDEGRVGADSWVWRTGWPEWKPGAEAVRSLAIEKARSTPPQPPRAAPATAPSAKAAPQRTTASPMPAPATLGSAVPAGSLSNGRAGKHGVATAAGAVVRGKSPSLPFEMDDEFDQLYVPQSHGRNSADPMKPALKTAAHDLRMRRRKANQIITAVLAVLALVLLVTAIVVLNRASGEAAPDVIPAPASASTAPS